MRALRHVLVLAPALLVCGCIVEAPTSEDLPARRQATVEQVPSTALKNGAIFDGKVQLVGAQVSPGALAPGGEVTVTVFYKVLSELQEDVEVFVHAEDPGGLMKRFVRDHRPAGGGYPSTRWRPDETIRDTYTLRLPSGPVPASINVWTGLWVPKTERRLSVGNAEGVRHDGDNRVLLIQLPVKR